MKIKKLIEEGKTPNEMMNESKGYCPLLWSHLHVTTNGEILPCCVGDWNRPLGNINDQAVDDFWHGERMKEMRADMVNDKMRPECKLCYSREKNDGWSLRKDAIRKFHNDVTDWVMDTDEEGNSPDSKPIYLDIRFSNICNMRCRMCGHFSSSRWFNDAKVLRDDHGISNYITSNPNAIVRSVDDTDAFMNTLEEWLPDAKELYFAGGEPMIMEEHYRILKKLDELELYDVFLRYNTNLMQMTYKDLDIVELWKKFKNVQCAASIDAIGDRAEIIRKDTVWETVEANALRIVNETPHVKFGIAPTVQVMNIYHLGEVHRSWMEKGILGPNDMFLNILENPKYHNVRILPKHMKEEATQVLNDHAAWLIENYPGKSPLTVDTIGNTISFMNSEQHDEKLLSEFVHHTKLLDKMRKEDSFAVFPELQYIWDNYGTT